MLCWGPYIAITILGMGSAGAGGTSGKRCLFLWGLNQPFGFELLVEGSDGSGNEVGIGGIEGSAGDGVFELALNGSDQGFGGRAEVHGKGSGLWGPVGSGDWYWAVVMACRVSWAGAERCRRLNEV